MLKNYEIELLEEMVQEKQYENNVPLCTSFVKDLLEEYKKLKKRDTPMKPDKHSYEELNELPYCKFTCAVCGRIIHKNHEVYCADCGNKIDWSDEK